MSTRESASLFQRIVLPAIVLQSLLIGGGYSTGREIVEYAGKYGPAGWLSLSVIFVGFTVMAALTFELARVYRVYDYKNWIRQLIGPLWPLFDVLFFVMVLLVIAVMISAVGSILEQTLAVPYLVGIATAFAVVALLAYHGERVIEQFKTVGTGLLYLGYLVFAAVVLSRTLVDGPSIGSTPAAGAAPEGFGLGAVLASGVLYVGYNLAVYPAALFTLHRQTRRRDAIVSGLVAGVMMTIPFALTLLCLMRFYPAEAVMGAEVPWLKMLEVVGGPAVIALYGAVVGWTLVETAVGAIHAVIDRIDRNLGDLPMAASRISRFSRRQRGLVAAGILLGAMALAQFGIIALVATGYRLIAYGFIALMAVPLLTIGVVRIRKPASD